MPFYQREVQGERNGRDGENPANGQRQHRAHQQPVQRLLGVFRGGTSGGPWRHRDARGRIAGEGVDTSKPQGERELAGAAANLVPVAGPTGRRLHRPAHQRDAERAGTIQLVTANVQGMSHARADSRLKWAALVDEARRGGWDVVLLSELHSPPEERQTIVLVEEFTVVVGGGVGIMMSPAVARHWWRQARQPLYCESGRIVAAELLVSILELCFG